jgi:hypothetical protein
VHRYPCSNPAAASPYEYPVREIEVRFSADGPEQTTVTLEHRHLERLVDGQALRDGITGGGGWSSLLELLAKAATNQA